MSSEQQLGQIFGDAVQPVDPSVQYAEAFMDGEPSVTVVTPSGLRISYEIGREYPQNTYPNRSYPSRSYPEKSYF